MTIVFKPGFRIQEQVTASIVDLSVINMHKIFAWNQNLEYPENENFRKERKAVKEKKELSLK